MKRLTKLLQTALLALTLSAPALSFGDVPKPAIPPAVQGEECVEPVDVMRRQHGAMLNVHRDRTFHEGIRTPEHSLVGCIDCHVAADAAGSQAASVQRNEEHFCVTCHAYAGVRIDCFECHATKPETKANFHPLVTPGMKEAKAAHQPAGALLNRLAGAE